MRIQLLSDIHTEYHRDGGESFIASMDPTGVDILVLAGDIASLETLGEVVEGFLARGYPEIVFVAGNHEFYGHTYEDVWEEQGALSYLEHFHWLENSTCEIGGQRFLGCTLWFANHPLNDLYRNTTDDFLKIRRLHSWVYTANTESKRFLAETIQPSDIVITHHMPTPSAVSSRFHNSTLNRYFYTDLDNLILDTEPKLWLFGHTHDSKDFPMGKTRLVCNPFGYVHQVPNPEFQDRLIIEV